MHARDCPRLGLRRQRPPGGRSSAFGGIRPARRADRRLVRPR
ncbi:hypothetical protein PAI11_21240 [Patulibacter medicamentivorans]|uniref:Uncharacterized protein n=1 Tax=Patulibacter medicamentivorans TaxID=1097667 RepID=H0E5M9_9ACTN|nr:hypothetical protein PAI11_21240 [Patulibacter medicamentivorans]